MRGLKKDPSFNTVKFSLTAVERLCYYGRVKGEAMKLLKAAIENQRWDVAAHALVIGMVKAKRRENGDGKKRRSVSRPKRS